jgi:hypothetical protein
MKHLALIPVLAALMNVPFGSATTAPTHTRAIPCKTPEIAASCYWTHGRLVWAEGTPSFRLWKIGTKRVLGIYSGPSVDPRGLDSERPELPANVAGLFSDFEDYIRVFADFEVCPLEPEKAGEMQAACIESARHIVVRK